MFGEPPGAAPPKVGPRLAEFAVELPDPRAACAACDPNNCCAKLTKFGLGGPSGETVT